MIIIYYQISLTFLLGSNTDSISVSPLHVILDELILSGLWIVTVPLMKELLTDVTLKFNWGDPSLPWLLSALVPASWILMLETSFSSNHDNDGCTGLVHWNTALSLGHIMLLLLSLISTPGTTVYIIQYTMLSLNYIPCTWTIIVKINSETILNILNLLLSTSTRALDKFQLKFLNFTSTYVNQSCPGCFIVIVSYFGFPIDHTNEIKIPLIMTVIVWYFNGVMSSNLIRDALC